MKYALVLVLCSALLIAACGDDSASNKPDDPLSGYLDQGDKPNIPGGFPGGIPGNVPGLKPDGMPKSFALTDKMMEEYVQLQKELMKMGESAPTAAWLASRKWDMARWILITGMIYRSKASVGVEDQTKRLEKMIAKHEEQLKTAEGSQKQTLEMWIKNEKERLEQLKQMPAATDVDRKNNEVIERWLPKIEAASRGG